ncbi:hypothetical protein ACFPRL_27125 [Pseudoclavibacter helvolus]
MPPPCTFQKIAEFTTSFASAERRSFSTTDQFSSPSASFAIDSASTSGCSDAANAIPAYRA